jgi:hypothetical protein
VTSAGKSSKFTRSNVEVDQSGKIERTQVDTVLAFSDGQSYAIRIPAAVKRRVLSFLRQKPRRSGNKKVVYAHLFAAALYLLLRAHLNAVDFITIDTEYTGGEEDIRRILLPLIRRVDPQYSSARIAFAQVGKKSPAHILALEVYRGTRQANHVVAEQELLALL